MYADDTHVTYAGDCVDNLQLYLNQDLDNVHNWLRANKLTLNMTKTEFMLIGSRQRLSTLTDSPTITIHDSQVSQVTTAKSLGVTIDNKLDWSSHIDKLTKKVASGIKFERRETAYNLRDSENKLNVPLPRTNYYKNSFSYSGATLWNSLPRDIRQAESLGLFKRLIKEVRLGTAFMESSFS